MAVKKNLGSRGLRIASIILILLIVISMILVASTTAREMVVTTSVSLEHQEEEEIVSLTISGRATGPLNQSISNVAISIQVEDPYGGTVHIALVYSKIDGSFIAPFLLKGDFLPGNYSIYLTASKIGYSDVNVAIPFSIVIYDFSISANPDTQEVLQGDTAIYEIILIRTSDQNFSISLTLAGLPGNTSYLFSDGPDTLEAKSTLYLNTSKDTPKGTYNLTLISQGGGRIHSLPIILSVIEEIEENGEETPPIEIEPRDYRALLLFIILIPIIAIFLLLIYLLKIGKITFRRIRKAEPKKDKEYLATARALAKLEELRARDKVDEKTYNKLKKEYEEKLRD